MTASAAAPLVLEKHDPNHVRGLDGLRGLAIILVMGTHVLWANGAATGGLVNLLYQVAHTGWAGVDLFFVLSGFLITRILFQTRHEAGYFKNFYARRILRIFPLYYGMLFVLMILTPILNFHWRGWLPWYLTYMGTLRPSGPSPIQPIPSQYWSITHFWSLQIEEQFYLVWPFVVWWLATKKKIIVVAICLSVFAVAVRTAITFGPALQNPWWTYCFTFCRIDSLLMGGMLSLLWFSRARHAIERLAWPVFIICMAVICVDGWMHSGLEMIGDRFMTTAGYSILALASASLIALVMGAGWVSRLFSITPLRWMGRYSYGLYVFHGPLNVLMNGPSRKLFFDYTHSKLLSVLLSAFVIVAASILAAYVSYELYESKFLRLKRYFAYNKPVAYQQTGI